MTPVELKTLLAEPGNYFKWHDTIALSLNLPHLTFNEQFTGLVNIYDFVYRQIEGFSKYEKLPAEIAVSKKRFEHVRNSIVTAVKAKAEYDHEVRSSFGSLVTHAGTTFLYDMPQTIFLADLADKNSTYYHGALEYIQGQMQHINNKDYFGGYIMAYEFESQSNSKLMKRRKAEEKAIESIRSDFQQLFNASQNEFAAKIATAAEDYVKHIASINEQFTDQENAYKKWSGDEIRAFGEFNAQKKKKMDELEQLYHEKLKLEAPATYWRERAKKLRKEGYIWIGFLVVSVAITVGVLIWILGNISNGTIADIFKDTAVAVKWTVTVITAMSFLAYVVRIFAKMSFSSFHLVRDAEEREQLAYVYLALKKEKGIDVTERHLVMQSLFSRADSGLLKDDTSPTMPGNIIDQVTKK